MNIHEYIQSGTLESYVLGTTTEAETVVVEQLAKEHDSIQSELTQIQKVLENYAFAHAVTPPSHLKEQIQKKINLVNKNNIVSFNPQKTTSRLNVAASWVLLAISLSGNLWFWNGLKSSEDKVLALESKNLQLAQNEQILKANYQQEVAILQNNQIKHIDLAGQDVAPNAKAMVYWNQQTNEVYLSSLKLPVTPSDKQYQLWAIVDGKPVDAGMIDGTSHILKMKSMAKAVAFAISLEAKGGSTTEAGPKGTIYVMGAV